MTHARARLFSNRALTGLVILTMVLSVLILAPTPALAGNCTVTSLVPQLREVRIHQGVGSYPSIVPDKDLLVKFYLSRPACATAKGGATQTLSLTGATLTVRSGGVPLGGSAPTVAAPNQTLQPAPPIVTFEQAPANDSTGDPLWIVDGSALDASTSDQTLTFEATINYTGTFGPGSVSISTFGGQTITKTLLAEPNDLRVLAIPMGTTDTGINATTPQFSESARTATLNGLSTLARIFPVANGTGDLQGISEAGIKYVLDEGGLVEVGSAFSGGRFCGTSGNFASIQSSLAGFLTAYNTAQTDPSKTADRVMGVIDEAISSSCAEGMAAVNSRESWSRALYTTTPSITGATIAMELTHNGGGVPCGLDPNVQGCLVDRDSPADAFHSPRTNADFDALNRAYNLSTRQWLGVGGPLGDDKTATRLSTGWNSNTAVLESTDWNLLLCRLGGPLTSDCTAAETSATAAAVFSEVTNIVGTVDLAAEPPTAEIFDSYVAPGPETSPSAASDCSVVQLDGEDNVVAQDPVQLFADDSIHDEHSEPVILSEGVFYFSASFETHPLATEMRLRCNGVDVYEKSETAPPVIDQFEVSRPSECPDFPATTDATALESEDAFSESAERIIFEPSEGRTQRGEVITTQYQDRGVTFVEDETTRATIELNEFNSPFDPPPTTHSGEQFLFNSAKTVTPGSAGVPLTMNFTCPQSQVGMYIGNDDDSTETATLTAYDSTGEPLFSTSKSNFGNSIQTFIGIDAHGTVIDHVTLDYGQTTLGEAIDDLLFEVEEPVIVDGGEFLIAQEESTNTYDVFLQASDEDPNSLKASFFAVCDELNLPLAVGVPPDDTGEEGEAFWNEEFDADKICQTNSATIKVRVSDGYSLSPFSEDTVDSPPQVDPTAIPHSPAPDLELLEHEAIPLDGEGWDLEDGDLTGAQLEWFLSGPSFTGEVSQGTGNTLDVPAPVGGWTPGLHTARLVVTDSDGNTGEASVDFTILPDDDNDGVIAPTEACAGANDQNPFDAESDGDGDGIPNHEDPDACTPATEYEATVDYEPNTTTLTSKGSPITLRIRLRHRNVADIVGSSVQLTEVAGFEVPTGAIRRTGWSIERKMGQVFGIAQFSRPDFVKFLTDNGVTHRQRIVVLVEGDGVSGAQSWSFFGADFTDIQ